MIRRQKHELGCRKSSKQCADRLGVWEKKWISVSMALMISKLVSVALNLNAMTLISNCTVNAKRTWS